MTIDLDYHEAKRQARAFLGPDADVKKFPTIPFPARVGVWHRNRFVIVGVGTTYTEALADAKSRDVTKEQE